MPKFTIMFKMPNAGSDAIQQAIDYGILKAGDVTTAKKLVEKFVEYDEYVYIELDTEARTARVLPVSHD